MFLDLLKLSRAKYTKIAHAISASIAILESYMTYTRRTQVYALAMGKYAFLSGLYCFTAESMLGHRVVRPSQ